MLSEETISQVSSYRDRNRQSNSVDVDTMLMKRRQKFFDGFEQLNNLVCQITMSCN